MYICLPCTKTEKTKGTSDTYASVGAIPPYINPLMPRKREGFHAHSQTLAQIGLKLAFNGPRTFLGLKTVLRTKGGGTTSLKR
ncbi:hypothetical protein AAMO2058_000875900 [Amorphochlora amoebiformis]